MEDFAKYIDVLIQAPLAVIMMWLIYKTFKFNTKQLETYKKIIKNLIDKIKFN